MAISKKRSPKVDTDNMERVIQQIYTDLNEIIDSVNQGDTSEGKGSHTGKSGDIRIIKRSNNVYHLGFMSLWLRRPKMMIKIRNKEK